ncbi:MAG TPA: TerC family protein [Elusimicrobiota bacterium]|nr:TerC family protein [Elusimicrobiota bacterium]
MPGQASLYFSVGKIVLIDMVLSADNAVLIAMASHRLPARKQRQAIVWGAAGAILLRVAFTALLARLLDVPLLRFFGGLVLAWIAVKLLLGEEASRRPVKEAGSLLEAVATIIVADLVMSLDNMLAVGGAAGGDLRLLALGLLASIAIIMSCSALIAGWMNRFPALVLAGAGVLAFTAGEMLLNDGAVAAKLVGALGFCLSRAWHEPLHGLLDGLPHRHAAGWAFCAAFAAAVLALPRALRRRP